MKRWMYSTLMAVWCFPALADSNANQLHIVGDASETTTGKLIPKTHVYALHGVDTVYSAITPQKATYDFKLELDKLYTIWFEKEGYVSKFVEIDAREVPEEKAERGFEMKVDITLFKQYDGFDYSILNKKPIGKARYYKKLEVIDWDLAYTKKMLKLLEKLNRDGQKAQMRLAQGKPDKKEKDKKNNIGINPDKIKRTDDICHQEFYGKTIICTRTISPSAGLEGAYRIMLTINNPHQDKSSYTKIREKLPPGYSIECTDCKGGVSKKEGNVWELSFNPTPKGESLTISYLVKPGKRVVEDPTICGVLDFSMKERPGTKERIEIRTALLFENR